MAPDVSRVVDLVRTAQNETAVVHAYSEDTLGLWRALKTWDSTLEPAIAQHLVPLIEGHLEKYADSTNPEAVQAIVKCVGFIVPREGVPIASSRLPQLLLRVLSSSRQKNVIYYVLWCLSVQRHPDAFVPLLAPLLDAIGATLASYPSPSLQKEALLAIRTFVGQLRIEMQQHCCTWAPFVYMRLLNTNIEIAKFADETFNAALELLVPAPPELSELVRKHLGEGLLQTMTVSIRSPPENITREQILTTWSYLVVLLGPRLLFKYLINDMLAIPRLTFTRKEATLRAQSFQAWRYFMWCVAGEMDKLVVGTKRINLLMMPITTTMSKETDSRVRQTCFSVWAQLIHVLSVYDLDGFPSIFAVFDAVIEPLISLVVKNHRNQQVSPELSLHVLELFACMLGDTPELERSSVELAASAQLHEVDVPSPAEGLLFPPNFLPDHLGMFLDLISYCYENGITSSPPPQPASQQQQQPQPAQPASNASSVENLWRHLCVRLLRQAENSKLSREHFVQLLSFPCVGTLPTAARSKLLAIVLELLPSSVLRDGEYDVEADGTSQPPLVHLAKQWFEACARETEPANLERSRAWRAGSDSILQLLSNDERQWTASAAELLSLLDRVGKRSEPAELQHLLLLALWNPVASAVAELVKSSNSIGPGAGWEFLYQLLLLPFGWSFAGWQHVAIDAASQLPFEHAAATPGSPSRRAAVSAESDQPAGAAALVAVIERWRHVYHVLQTVARQKRGSHGFIAGAMCSRLCKQLDQLDTDKLDGSHVVLLQLLGGCIGALCTTYESSTQAAKQSSSSPSKLSSWTSDADHWLPHFLKVLSWLVQAMHSLSSQYVLLAKNAIKLLNSVKKLFASTHTATATAILIEHLEPSIVVWLTSPKVNAANMPGTDSTQLLSAVVSLWQALLECVRRCYAVFDTALLAKLSSLLQVAFSSKYRDLKDHTVAFWNETFARTPTLEYPPALVPLFRRIKQLYALTLPNWNADAQPSASAAANDALLASCSATEGLDDPSVHVPPVVQAANYYDKHPAKRDEQPARAAAGSKANLTGVKRDRDNFQIPSNGTSEFVEITRPNKTGPAVLTEKQQEAWVEQHQQLKQYSGLSKELSMSAITDNSLPMEVESDTNNLSPPAKRQRADPIEPLNVGNSNSISGSEYMNLVQSLVMNSEMAVLKQLSRRQVAATQKSLASLMHRLVEHLEEEEEEEERAAEPSNTSPLMKIFPSTKAANQNGTNGHAKATEESS